MYLVISIKEDDLIREGVLFRCLVVGLNYSSYFVHHFSFSYIYMFFTMNLSIILPLK